MAAAEQARFKVPGIEERGDLILVDTVSATRRTDSIGSAAARAAEVAATVLNIDQQQAEDTFTGQLEAMGITELASNLVPVVYVTVGAEDNDGGVWTPSHVIKGHDELTTTDGKKIPGTYVWPVMYANRPAAWWNKTRPDGQGESELVEAPLQIVLADLAFRGTGKKKWDQQQDELKKLISKGHTPTVTVEGMPILTWAMMDADAIIGGTERPDTETWNRFVQHNRDRSAAFDSYGPIASVRGRQADLAGSDGGGRSDEGFRAVMGQKKTA